MKVSKEGVCHIIVQVCSCKELNMIIILSLYKYAVAKGFTPCPVFYLEMLADQLRELR